MAQWIDFKELRKRVRFQDLIEHYAVKGTTKKGRFHGYCPLPTHEGKGRSPSFSVNFEKGIWQCFGCGAKGNVIDFAIRMEGGDPQSGEDVRQTALMLSRRFLGDTEESPAPKQAEKQKEKPPETDKEADQSSTVVNQPLDFALKRLEPDHPYLRDRGFSQETISHFGLGYCKRGMLAGRIAIPIHNPEGQLVGYAGRLVDGQDESKEAPKYKFPPKREKDGVTYELRKSLLVYNLHRVGQPADELIVVEGFPSVWWLWQAGFPHIVALMGASCSSRQAELITAAVAPAGRIWLVPDGDEAGEQCAATALPLLGRERFTRWVKLDSGKQPTDCSPQELQALLEAPQQSSK